MYAFYPLDLHGYWLDNKTGLKVSSVLVMEMAASEFFRFIYHNCHACWTGIVVVVTLITNVTVFMHEQRLQIFDSGDGIHSRQFICNSVTTSIDFVTKVEG